ncbi:MAG: hypothetical protein U0936_20915 [Planctomycetaceae bacterium]
MGSRHDLVARSANSTANKAATHALQELLVLLERTEARVSDTELHVPVAWFQACMDSLLRLKRPLIP